MSCIHEWARFGSNAAHPLCAILVLLQVAKLLLVYLELLVELFAKRLDIVERFGISVCELYLTTGKKNVAAHFVASKMSSNFFFNAAGSDKGQFDSSW